MRSRSCTDAFSLSSAHPGALPALAFDDEPAPADQLACGELGSAPARAAVAHAAANVADLDAPLSPADRAEAAAFRALVEERLAPATVRFAPARAPPPAQTALSSAHLSLLQLSCTWEDSAAFGRHTRRAYGSALPLVAAGAETRRWRRAELSRLSRRGSLDGCACPALLAEAAQALASLAARLAASGAGPWLLGACPCSADASLLAQLAYILHAPVCAGPLRAALRSHPRLVSYLEAACASPMQLLAGAAARVGPRAGVPPLRAPRPKRDARAAHPPAGMSERRKSQLSVLFALSSALLYVVLHDLLDIQFLEEEEEEEAQADGYTGLEEDDGSDDD